MLLYSPESLFEWRQMPSFLVNSLSEPEQNPDCFPDGLINKKRRSTPITGYCAQKQFIQQQRSRQLKESNEEFKKTL